jgi:hypothetical protein
MIMMIMIKMIIMIMIIMIMIIMIMIIMIIMIIPAALPSLAPFQSIDDTLNNIDTITTNDTSSI